MKPFINQVQDTSLKPGEVASISIVSLTNESISGSPYTVVCGSGTYVVGAKGQLLIQLNSAIGLLSLLPPAGNAMSGIVTFDSIQATFNTGIQMQQATVEQIGSAYSSILIPVNKGDNIVWTVNDHAILPPPGGTAYFGPATVTFTNIAQ